MNSNPRKDAFIKELEASREGVIQDWFKMLRANCSHLRREVERDYFMMGAVPECFDYNFEYTESLVKSNAVQNAFNLGIVIRDKNPPPVLGAFTKAFRFENENGGYTYYKLVLDPAVIGCFISRVKKSKSFC